MKSRKEKKESRAREKGVRSKWKGVKKKCKKKEDDVMEMRKYRQKQKEKALEEELRRKYLDANQRHRPGKATVVQRNKKMPTK